MKKNAPNSNRAPPPPLKYKYIINNRTSEIEKLLHSFAELIPSFIRCKC